MPWKVPDHSTRPGPEPPLFGIWAAICSARRVIVCAARRVKVRSRMRLGSAPRTMRWATRCASVVVLPVPAPAMIRSGPGS